MRLWRATKGRDIKPGNKIAATKYRGNMYADLSGVIPFIVIKTERRVPIGLKSKKWFITGIFCDEYTGELNAVREEVNIELKQTYGFWTDEIEKEHAVLRNEWAEQHKKDTVAFECLQALQAVGVKCEISYGNSILIDEQSLPLLYKLLPPVLVFAGKLKGI